MSCIYKKGENTDVKIYRRVLLWQFRSTGTQHETEQNCSKADGNLDAKRRL